MLFQETKQQLHLPQTVHTFLGMQTFAIMGGLYSAVNCFMKRLRQKDDGEFMSVQYNCPADCHKGQTKTYMRCVA